MSETRSVRITDPELDDWIDQNIPRGGFNEINNQLWRQYRDKQEQVYVEEFHEETVNKIILIYQGIVFLCLGVWFVAFAATQIWYPALTVFAYVFMIVCGVMLCFYVILQKKITTTKKTVRQVGE